MPSVRDSQIVLTIAHPHGDVELTLEEWMFRGPGLTRYVQPVHARDEVTGRKLSLKVIPFRFRNTNLSRLLISLRLVKDPWRRR